MKKRPERVGQFGNGYHQKHVLEAIQKAMGETAWKEYGNGITSFMSGVCASIHPELNRIDAAKKAFSRVVP